MPLVRWPAVTVAILTVACGAQARGATPGPVTCREEGAPGVRPFQLAEAPALFGRYRLTTVTTNWPDPIPPQQSKLVLWANAPERLVEVKRFGYRPGARPLAGVVTYDDGRNNVGSATDHTSAQYPAVELIDSVLYLGTPDGLDAAGPQARKALSWNIPAARSRSVCMPRRLALAGHGGMLSRYQASCAPWRATSPA